MDTSSSEDQNLTTTTPLPNGNGNENAPTNGTLIDDQPSTSRGVKRLARLYNVTEASLMLEELPTDLSEVTDEEPESDADDPEYDPPQPHRSVDTRIDQLTIAASSDPDGESMKPTQTLPHHAKPLNWRRRPVNKIVRPFDRDEGPCLEHFRHCHTPGEYFRTFFNDDILDNLVFQSNLYLQQRQRRVSPIEKQDLLGYLGINFFMGYHVLPSYTHYLRNDSDLGVPLVSSVMSRDRFTQLLGNLHVNDNTNLNTNDKLSKVCPLMNQANESFAKLYDVNRIQSIDESMILFKGRSTLKQYCPMKPIKRGYKLWVRADENGYIAKFDIYQRKGGGDVGAKYPGFELG